MDWVTSIHQAIQYIEENLREELTIRDIAQQAALSPFYFQKGFDLVRLRLRHCLAQQRAHRRLQGLRQGDQQIGVRDGQALLPF